MISIVREGDIAKVGTVSSSSVDPEQISVLVQASEEAARTATPADDASRPDHAVGGRDRLGPAGRPDRHRCLCSVGCRPGEGLRPAATSCSASLTTSCTPPGSELRRACDVERLRPPAPWKSTASAGDASAWVGSGTVDFSDISIPKLLSQLTTRLDWAGNSVSLPAGRYETILPPSAVADLMIYLMWTMEGRGAEEGHTALSTTGGTRIGEKLGLPLTLTSDPGAEGLQSAPFVITTSSSESVSLFGQRYGDRTRRLGPRRRRQCAGVPAPRCTRIRSTCRSSRRQSHPDRW